jgi:putative PEP-CTERM system histidine kinase
MTIGTLSYLAGALSYLFLSILLLTSWNGKKYGIWLIVACLVTTVWSGTLAVQEAYQKIASPLIWTWEVLHSSVWLLFLSKLLNRGVEKRPSSGGRLLSNRQRILFGMVGSFLLYIWLSYYFEWRYPEFFRPPYRLSGHILFAVLGLILIEQFYRNTRPDLRWFIKFLCFALGAIFAFDFYLYSDALLFHRIDHNLWIARGIVVAMVTPLIAVAAVRNQDWSFDIFVSRQMVFHSATLLGAGVYLLLMASVGYYIKLHGGEWGAVAQIVFLVGAFLVLVLLLFSGQIRARIRVFLSKHFFNYAYDYRQEWLRIISTLSDTQTGMSLESRIILALSELVESPSGTLWVRDARGNFLQRADYGNPEIDIPTIYGDDELVRFMHERAWIINLDELESQPELYLGLHRPAWLASYDQAWLLIPLFHEKEIFGLVLLTQPRTAIDWNWEVIALLKTASQQASSYLALKDAARELAEARQFEGFNRLSAFVIHDLKNLVAQLTLVVRNAERHRDNPEFMQDAIKTVEHAVDKMNRLMSQLRHSNVTSTAHLLDLGELLMEVVQARQRQLPIPVCEKVTETLRVSANRDRLASALEHIIQNAQDAAGRNGEVNVRLSALNSHAIVDIEDNGHGMDADFIRSRLFKPFETTKGLTGMGIGAYESREYVRSLGGDLAVDSQPGEGSLFRFTIPLAREH